LKEFHGTATQVVAAPVEDCLSLLRAVDGYPTWFPEMVRDVEVLQRDASDQPTRARTKLHVARGPLVHDFDLLMAIAVEPPGTVKLSKVTSDRSPSRFDVTWSLQAAESTRIELNLSATLSVSELVPVGDIGNAIAEQFVVAASRALASDTPS
jgi:ribosome-associated toxin RatA of RatAB toxin-antitoxin module